MVTGMTPAMAAAMGHVCVLAIVVLALAAAALVEYFGQEASHDLNEDHEDRVGLWRLETCCKWARRCRG